jgi:hypothetical protein
MHSIRLMSQIIQTSFISGDLDHLANFAIAPNAGQHDVINA